MMFMMFMMENPGSTRELKNSLANTGIYITNIMNIMVL